MGFSPGNFTILQSYKPPHGMGCKILPGNLTILQTTSLDVRFSQGILQFHKSPQCLHVGFVLYRFGECLRFWEPRPSDFVNVAGSVNLDFQIR